MAYLAGNHTVAYGAAVSSLSTSAIATSGGPGSVFFVAVARDKNYSVRAITDDLGNVFVLVKYIQAIVGQNAIDLYFCAAGNGSASHAITVALNGSNASVSIMFFEALHLQPYPLDLVSVNASRAASVATGTKAAADNLVVAAGAAAGANSGDTWSIDSAFTLVDSTTPDLLAIPGAVAVKVTASLLSNSPTWSLTPIGGANHVSVIAAFACLPGPWFSQQPQSVTQAAGATATFTVSNEYAVTITRVWQRWHDASGNFIDIFGATGASYTTAPLAAADNGARFRCVAIDVNGSTTSQEACVYIAGLPVTGKGRR